MIYQIETRNILAEKVITLMAYFHWIVPLRGSEQASAAETSRVGGAVVRSLQEVRAHIAGKKQLADISDRIDEL